MCGTCLCSIRHDLCIVCYEEICVIWVNMSFVHSSHLVHQVGGKLIHIKANGSRISVIHYLIQTIYVKLGPHDAWFVFVMRHASWFSHRVYEKMCLIWVDVSFVHLSHLVRQLDSKLTHESKLYVSDSTNLFDTFTHDAPRIRTTHRVDPAIEIRRILAFGECENGSE